LYSLLYAVLLLLLETKGVQPQQARVCWLIYQMVTKFERRK
jgi:hypothetical protein